MGGITILKNCELNILLRAALSQRSRWEDEVSMLTRAERGQKGEQVLKIPFLFLNDSQSSELYPSCFGSSAAKSLAVTLTEGKKIKKEKKRDTSYRQLYHSH